MLSEAPGARATVDHVGIAVTDLEAAVALQESLLGHAPQLRERVEADGIEAVFFDAGSCAVELLASLRADSPVGRFLERRGPGLHHLALRVEDIELELARWRDRGADLVDPRPRPGARGMLVAFVHPRSTGGLLIELCQPSAPAG